MKNSDETSLSVLSIKLLLIYIIDFGQSYEWLAVLVDQINQSSKMELKISKNGFKNGTKTSINRGMESTPKQGEFKRDQLTKSNSSSSE